MKTGDSTNKHRLLFVLTVYAILTLPVFAGELSNGLDPSWQYFLNKVTSFKNIRFGRDVIFTFGPAGFLFGPMNINENMYVSAGIYSCLFVFQLVVFYKVIQKKNMPIFAVLFFVLMMFLGRPSKSADIYIEFCAFLGLAVLWQDIDDVLAAVYTTVLATLAFFFKFSVAIAVISAYFLFLIGKVMQKQFRRIWILFLPCALIPGCYMIYNPSFHDFLRFVKGSLEMASGYNTGLSLPNHDIYAFWIVLMMVIYIVIMILQIVTKQYSNFFILLWIAPGLFMAYKHGYVRADIHTMSAYSELLSLFSIVILLLDYNYLIDGFIGHKRNAMFQGGLAILLCLTALLNYDPDLHPWTSLRNQIHELPAHFSKSIQAKEVEKLYKLSEDTIEMLNGNTFTSYPWEISFLENNDELSDDYIPLPVVQMYSAYTSYLDNRVANMFRGYDINGVPQYILMSFNTIDGRLPFMEAPETWKEIFYNYSYVGKDSSTGWYILKKHDGRTRDARKIENAVLDKTDVIQTAGCSEVRVHLNLGLKGILTKLLWKIPEVRATVIYTDGTVKEGRVLPETLKNGITVKGLAYDNDSLIDALESSGIKSEIESILLSGDGLDFYESNMMVDYVYYEMEKPTDISYQEGSIDLSGRERGDNSEIRFNFDILIRSPYFKLRGWAYINNNEDKYDLYIKYKDKYYPCTKVSRQGVVDTFNLCGSAANVGFEASLGMPIENEISLILVTTGKYYELRIE